MILFIAKAVGYLILTLIGLYLSREVIFFIKSYKYIKQKMHFKYTPMIGYAGFMFERDGKDQIEPYLQLFEQEKKKGKTVDILLANSPTFLGPILFLNDKDLLSEFSKIETSVSQKCDTLDLPPTDSFLYKFGKRALDNRSVYHEIFYASNLKKMNKKIKLIIERHVKEIRKSLDSAGAKDKDGFVEVELKGHIQNIFTDFVGYVLFGDDIPVVNGKKLTELIEGTIALRIVSTFSPLNALSFGLYNFLGLSSEYNQSVKNFRQIYDFLAKVIKKRDKSTGYKRGLNAIDLVLNKNDQLRENNKLSEVLTEKEILDDIILLIFAGMDTSKNTTEASLDHLSRDVDLQKQLREDIAEKILTKNLQYDFDAYDAHRLLSLFLKESLRLFGPVYLGFTKLAKKNFKLGRYKIYKGTRMMVPHSALHRKPEYYSNPEKFDIQNFGDEEKLKKFGKHGYQPFSAGKRACIGKSLAELSIKMILTSFLGAFELRAPEGPQRKILQSTYGLETCRVKLRSLTVNY